MNPGDDDFFGPGKLTHIFVGTQLQLEIEGVSTRQKSVLVGMVSDKCLIVEASFANNIKNRLFQGNKIVVRFIYEGTVFGFESELIKAIFDPIKLLFISYPKIIARHELRSQKRFESFLPSDLSIKNKNYRGVILDINERGCRCLVTPLQDGNLPNVMISQGLTIKFQLPGVEDKVEISGIVKNFKRDINELHLGIQFDNISQIVQNKINQYVLSVQPS